MIGAASTLASGELFAVGAGDFQAPALPLGVFVQVSGALPSLEREWNALKIDTASATHRHADNDNHQT